MLNVHFIFYSKLALEQIVHVSFVSNARKLSSYLCIDKLDLQAYLLPVASHSYVVIYASVGTVSIFI